MPRRPSAIPVGTQFSPDLIDLDAFLQSLIAHGGHKERLMDAVWAPGVRTRRPVNPPTERQRSLPLEAAAQYGLLEPGTYRVTELARDLAPLKGDALFEGFARHILLNLGGTRVVEAAQQMKLDGRTVTGDHLAGYLTDQGFRVTVHNTAINSLRMWLARAGIFPERGWNVDADRKREVLGLEDTDIAALVGLTPEQRAFVLAICRINPRGDHPASDVRELAEQIVGHRLERGSLPKIMEPLRVAGFIDYATKGTAGGKTSLLRTTAKFEREVLEPFITETVKSLDSALTAYYRKPLAETYAELTSAEPSAKGMALEAYAIHVMRLLGLRFITWRKRASATGGAELDVLLTGLIGGLPSRWQVQCKNTPGGSVDLEDIAKEVGLVPLTNATHIAVLANCRFTNDAVRFANAVMRSSALSIFLLDESDFERVRRFPGSLARTLAAKSEAISRQHATDESVWLP